MKAPQTHIDHEAERCVIGCMLLGTTETIDAVFEVARTTDFTDPFHRLIVQAIAMLAEERKPVDAVTISSTLQDLGAKNEHTLSKLLSFTEAVPTASNAKHYAERIRDKRRIRDVVDAARSILSDSASVPDVAAFVAKSHASMFAAGEAEEAKPVIWADQMAADLWKHIESVADAKEQPGLKTGFAVLDAVGGLRPEEVAIVAGRPGSGKTAFLQNLILNVASQGKRVVMLSLEMAVTALAIRWNAMRSRVNTLRIERAWLMDQDEWTRVGTAVSRFSELQIGVIRESWLTIDEAARRLRRVHATKPIDLVVTDYLQLMSGERGQSREQQVSEISRGLKNLAVELGIPFVNASQLNRKCESRTDDKGRRGVPQLDDLRDSGAIEQDAASVMLLYRRHNYHDDAPETEATIIIGKHRYAPLGEYELYFEPKYQSFENARAQ